MTDNDLERAIRIAWARVMVMVMDKANSYPSFFVITLNHYQHLLDEQHKRASSPEFNRRNP